MYYISNPDFCRVVDKYANQSYGLRILYFTHCSNQMKGYCCLSCEFIKSECMEVRTTVMSVMLAVQLRLPFILKVACKSESLPYYMKTCKSYFKKENCGACLLVVLRQTNF